MRPATDISADPVRTGRALWIALVATCGILLSLCFACATPFAALAALTALKLDRRDAFATVGLVWVANQAIGYGVLGYPWTWQCAAWGLAIGASSCLAVLAARGLSTSRPAPLALSLPFVGAFASFELGLYVVGYILPGSDGAFTASIIAHVFLINAASLCGLIALHQLVALGGRFVRDQGAESLPAGAASLR
jgi:hypothetical protein